MRVTDKFSNFNKLNIVCKILLQIRGSKIREVFKHLEDFFKVAQIKIPVPDPPIPRIRSFGVINLG